MVFSALFTILRTGTLFLLLNDYFKRTYPEKYDNLLIEIPLKLIYVYSKCQVIYTKLQRKINEYIDANPSLRLLIKDIYKSNYSNDFEIEHIVKGIVVAKYKRSQTLPEKDDSFFIYSDLSEKCASKIIFHSKFDFNYKKSNIQFMMVECKFELKSETKCYKIVLKSDTYNYYVVNNVLDNKFFKYYLRKYHPELGEAVIDIKQFSVKIIDQNVNIETFDITEEKSIIIEENKYNYTI